MDDRYTKDLRKFDTIKIPKIQLIKQNDFDTFEVTH